MHLHVDFIGNQSVFALVESPEKIAANLNLIGPLKESIQARRKTSDKPISVASVFGRWIVVYESNVQALGSTQMYFIDFRFDIHDIAFKAFVESTAKNILQTQARYDKIYAPEFDTVEITLAELYEVPLSKNLFACNWDNKVLAKAKELGVLPILESIKPGDGIKVCFADEQVLIEGNSTKNVYALINFGGRSEKEGDDQGFAYLKLRDAKNNLDGLDLLLAKVQDTGATFDRLTVLERFTTARLN